MPEIRDLNISIELWSMAFCAVCIVCCLALVRDRGRQRSLIVAGLALEIAAAGCDALAGIFRGQEGQLAWAATHVGNAASFVACFFLLAALTSYLCLRIADAGGPRYRRWQAAVWILSAVMSVLTLVGAHFSIDTANVYRREAGYWMVPAYVVAVNGANTLLALRARRELGPVALSCMLFYTLAPVAAAVAQAIFYGVDLVIVAAVLGFVVIFLEMQSHTYDALAQRTRELARAREQAADDRIAATVSQIQPHFLFNTLDTIYVLAGEDPDAARKAIAAFSRYLSTNLESLNRTAPVPIETEMGHVRTYLELERTTDPERVAYGIDMQAGGFRVPALSVQTLAENAVKHGIGAKAEGGTVRVRTAELPGEYIVEVADDGVGFDPGAVAADGRAHIGIENTRARLAAMCGGTLEVTSAPGEGTRAVMRIPKQEGGNQTMRILAVDDKAMPRKALVQAVGEAAPEAEVVACANAAEALALPDAGGFDVAFLDVDMPGMDGIALARELKRLNPRVNVVFATGFGEYMADAFALHSSGYLRKPITAEAVAEELENLRFPPRSGKPGARGLTVHCFGDFEVFADGEPLRFERAKSKELLAYLVDRRGALVGLREVEAALWEGGGGGVSPSYVRVLVSDLRRALEGCGHGDALVRRRGSVGVNVTRFSCDYYRYLEGDPLALAAWHGEYMEQFSWAETTKAALFGGSGR